MKLIINRDERIREINLEGFIEALNDELLSSDPNSVIKQMGILSTKEKTSLKRCPENMTST